MPVVRSFDELVKVLEQQGVPHRAVALSREIELTSSAGLPGGLMIKWETKVPFVTVRHAVIEEIPKDRMQEIETAVVRMNHLLDVGGFGLDHLRHILYYKVAIPAFSLTSSEVIDKMARGVVANAKEFHEAFQAVVRGRAGVEIAQIYKDLAHARAVSFAFSGAFE